MDYRTEMHEPGTAATPLKEGERARTGTSRNGGVPLGPVASEPPAPAASQATGTARAAEKRARPRYKCEGSVEFRTEGVEVHTQATLTDLSLSGCYVELPATSAVNTFVNMVLDVKGVRVPLKGVVRTSFPLLGMGIEFTEIRDEDKLALEALLHRLDGDASMPLEITSVEGRAATPDLLMIMDPAAALNALAKFFQHNWSLTRTQFAELIGRSQEPDRGERF